MAKFISLVLSSVILLGFTKKAKPVENTIEVKGKVAVFGSAPHTYIGIKTDKYIYKISNPQDFKLKQLQNRVVDIKGVLLKNKIGAGFPNEIKVIELQKITK